MTVKSKETHLSEEDLITRLRNQGYVKLGAGAFGTVLQKPGSKHVLKIFSDKGYMTFVTACTARYQRNVNLPRLSRLTEYNSTSGHTFWTVQIEALQEGMTQAFYDTVKRLAKYLETGKAKHGKGLTVSQRKACNLLRAEWADVTGWDQDSAMRNDLHEKNAMVRPGTQDVVITDPFCLWGSGVPSQSGWDLSESSEERDSEPSAEIPSWHESQEPQQTDRQESLGL